MRVEICLYNFFTALVLLKHRSMVGFTMRIYVKSMYVCVHVCLLLGVLM